MKPSPEERTTCTVCNINMAIKHFDVGTLDINTQSLLVMFRIHEYKVEECPDCRRRRLCA